MPFVSADAVRSAVSNAAHYQQHLDATVACSPCRRLRRGELAAERRGALGVVRAFGHTLGPDGLLVPYGSGACPRFLFTPAGLGVVEAFLIPALAGFAVPRGVVILGVLAWRAISFLLPIPVGLIAYLSLPNSADVPPSAPAHPNADVA